jgi:hypothetical protein
MVSISEIVVCRTGGVPGILNGKGTPQDASNRECQHTISRIVKGVDGYRGLKKGLFAETVKRIEVG